MSKPVRSLVYYDFVQFDERPTELACTEHHHKTSVYIYSFALYFRRWEFNKEEAGNEVGAFYVALWNE